VLLARPRFCTKCYESVNTSSSSSGFPAFSTLYLVCTVPVDLEHHRLVEILPYRSSETFATWLAKHSGIEVVSRDCSREYAAAVRRAALVHSRQLDRFHLLKISES